MGSLLPLCRAYPHTHTGQQNVMSAERKCSKWSTNARKTRNVCQVCRDFRSTFKGFDSTWRGCMDKWLIKYQRSTCHICRGSLDNWPIFRDCPIEALARPKWHVGEEGLRLRRFELSSTEVDCSNGGRETLIHEAKTSCISRRQ